jgi:hypothetical protein
MFQPQLQDSLHDLLSWFLDPRSRVLDQEGEHRPAALAGHLACSVRALEAAPPAGTAVVKVGRPFDATAYVREDPAYRRMVVALCRFIQERLRLFVTQAYLHGSLATLDYAAGWSDVDTFLVIRRSVVTDAAALLELRRLCLEAWPLFRRICPLQHHGFIIASEPDLGSYPSQYLPPPVFDAALALLPDQPPLRLFVRPGDSGALHSLVERRQALQRAVREGVLKHHPNEGVYLQAGYRNADNGMIQLFSLLGYLMTVPAYVLDARGRACYKKSSFARARDCFSDAAWAVIERASAVRAAWPEREGVSYAGNAVPEWVRRLLGPDYFEDALRVLEEAVAAASPQASVEARA